MRAKILYLKLHIAEEEVLRAGGRARKLPGFKGWFEYLFYDIMAKEQLAAVLSRLVIYRSGVLKFVAYNYEFGISMLNSSQI